MIATFDTETVGLFGPVRIVGWFDGEIYRVSTDLKEWWNHAAHLCSIDDPRVWYAHNLDFDLAKVWEAVPSSRESIRWDRSIWINHRAVKVVFENGIELHDSLTLLPGSLRDVLESWGTKVGKLSSEELAKEGGFKDVEDYFKRVPTSDPKYREYLRHDVMGLYEVIKRLQEFTGLDESIFCRKLTTASLAVKLFQSWYPKQYEFLTHAKWSPENDAKMRRAFYGGRTEVFNNHVENGYHYDVNSLYPFVMGENEYPFGYPDEAKGESAARLWGWTRPGIYGERPYYGASIVTARVLVPKSLSIPPLPVRYGGRLIFPVGEIKGTWCGCELQNALDHGCKLLKVYDIMAWKQTSPYFAEWVARMSEKKRYAKGAEREFYKLLQNSLYGKFAQRREQQNIVEWTPEVQAKFRKTHTSYQVNATSCGLLASYDVRRFAAFMQPHIAAHITAYARVLLFNAITVEQDRGNVVVYTDTDSLVTQRPMNDASVDPSRYGKWKLETEVARGLYVSPKLYAETDHAGVESLKGKGLLRSYRETMSFATYEDIYAKLACGVSVVSLYANVPNRRRFLRSILAGLDVDEPRYESKSVHADTWQKRQIDWHTGETTPWTLKGLAKVIGKRDTLDND